MLLLFLLLLLLLLWGGGVLVPDPVPVGNAVSTPKPKGAEHSHTGSTTEPYGQGLRGQG